MNIADARNAICSHFYEHWRLKAPTIVGYEPQVRWWNREVKESPPKTQHWVRFSMETVSNEQTAMRGPVVEQYGKRHTNIGLVFIQLFFSKSSLVKDDDITLSVIASEPFYRAVPNKIWFRDPRIQELPEETDYFRANVIAEYQFDHVIF